MYKIQLKNIAFLLLAWSLYSPMSIHADTVNKRKSPEQIVMNYLRRSCYMTLLWHDGGRIMSLFSPTVFAEGRACLWKDSGVGGLWGFSGGYRRLFAERSRDQAWFLGMYAGFDVLNDMFKDLRKLDLYDVCNFEFHDFFKPSLIYPVRANLGIEVSAAQWGQWTTNFYRIKNFKAVKMIRDYGGISTTLEFYALPYIKPFIGGAISWVGTKSNDFKTERFLSGIIGLKWILSHWIDCEIKYVYDHKKYQYPINIGFQLKFDGIDPEHNYFKHCFTRPPKRYIPHYAALRQYSPLKQTEEYIEYAILFDWAEECTDSSGNEHDETTSI